MTPLDGQERATDEHLIEEGEEGFDLVRYPDWKVDLFRAGRAESNLAHAEAYRIQRQAEKAAGER